MEMSDLKVAAMAVGVVAAGAVLLSVPLKQRISAFFHAWAYYQRNMRESRVKWIGEANHERRRYLRMEGLLGPEPDITSVMDEEAKR